MFTLDIYNNSKKLSGRTVNQLQWNGHMINGRALVCCLLGIWVWRTGLKASMELELIHSVGDASKRSSPPSFWVFRVTFYLSALSLIPRLSSNSLGCCITFQVEPSFSFASIIGLCCLHLVFFLIILKKIWPNYLNNTKQIKTATKKQLSK